jgi:hypothetical protein
VQRFVDPNKCSFFFKLNIFKFQKKSENIVDVVNDVFYESEIFNYTTVQNRHYQHLEYCFRIFGSLECHFQIL